MTQQSPLHAVLEKAGAAFVEEAGWLVPAHFGDAAAEYRAARAAAAVFDVSARAKVELTGADAVTFLHNLCTNDVASLPVGAGCEAFLCTANARVVAHVLVYRLLLHDGREALWLDAVPGQGERLLKHFDHYLISEQVELADRTPEFKTENDELRKIIAELQQMLDAAASESEAMWEERQREYESLLEEKSEVIRGLHLKIQELQENQAPKRPAIKNESELEDACEELERERSKLAQERRELDQERLQLAEDEESLMRQMRETEIGMARERAEMARQRTELQRLHSDIRHELDQASRDTTLRDRLATLQRRHQDINGVRRG